MEQIDNRICRFGWDRMNSQAQNLSQLAGKLTAMINQVELAKKGVFLELLQPSYNLALGEWLL
jgi:hypothetical protein